MFCKHRSESQSEVWSRARRERCVTPYLDGGDVKRRGDAEHRHDHRLVLLIDEDLHVSDVLLAGHLGHVLIRHVRLSGSEEETEEGLRQTSATA